MTEPQNRDGKRIAAAKKVATKVVKNSDRTKPSKAAKSAGATTIELPNNDGRTDREAIAYAMVKPSLRHGQLAGELGNLMLAQLPEEQRPGAAEYRKETSKQIVEAQNGDLTIASQLLAAQALSLDAIFTELARRSAINLSEHRDAAEQYMRMALRAQTGCRTTLQALVDLHRPREQTVRHVHVNDGGQAIVTDEFHHHTGGRGNGKAFEQPQGTGTGAAGSSPALPGPDASRDGVPVPGNAERPVSDPRRQKPGRTARQPERVEARRQVSGDAEDTGAHSRAGPVPRRRQLAIPPKKAPGRKDPK